MMRIKEAIQRKRLIQRLNDDYAIQPLSDDLLHYVEWPSKQVTRDAYNANISDCNEEDLEKHRLDNLRSFVKELNARMSYPQQRALRVTWKRLCEAPKTSGRGNLHLMEKIMDKLQDEHPQMIRVFYRSAFLKCIEDRRRRCTTKSIATKRDHAHLIIDFIDNVLNIMFDEPISKPVFDPISLAVIHSHLAPLGFNREIWIKMGEIFAETMFTLDIIRGYPHAAIAWSMFSVVFTEKLYEYSKPQRESTTSRHNSFSPSSSTVGQNFCLPPTPHPTHRSLENVNSEPEDVFESPRASVAPPNTLRRRSSCSSIGTARRLLPMCIKDGSPSLSAMDACPHLRTTGKLLPRIPL